MFRYLSLRSQLIQERAKSAKLNDEAQKSTADLDYLAMMCGIEMEMNENAESKIPESESLL